MHEALPHVPLEGAPEDQALLVAPEVREADGESAPLIPLNEEPVDETPIAIDLAPETAEPAGEAEDLTADVPAAAEAVETEPEAEVPAPKPKRHRGKKAVEAAETAEPEAPVAEAEAPVAMAPEASQDAQEAVEDEDTVEMPVEGEVATGGLARAWKGYWAERRDKARRAALARQHIEAEHELALEAANQLPADASPDQLRDKMSELRAQRAEAEAGQRQATEFETQKQQALAEAARMEREAAQLEERIERELAPAYAKHYARFEKVRPTVESALQGMAEAVAARDAYVDQAAALRSQADALRAQYDETRVRLERFGEPMAA